MREEWFDALMDGFAKAIKEQPAKLSVRSARKLDKLMKKREWGLEWRNGHAQIMLYDLPDYNFSMLQREFDFALECERFYGSPEYKKEIQDRKKS